MCSGCRGALISLHLLRTPPACAAIREQRRPPKRSKPFSRTKGVQGKQAQPKPKGTAGTSSAPPKPPLVAGK
eukprot:5091838-Prymnesium_polylepis.1